MRKLSKSEIVTQPDNSSEFPYMQILEEFFARRVEEERKAAEAQGSCQFFYDMSANPNEEDQVDRGGKRRKNDNDQFFGSEKRPREQNIKPDTCWFCLSNVGAEKHLIISIGSKINI